MRYVLLSLLMCGFASASFATTWTVSNVSNRPAQFTNLANAQSSAVDGDTILVYGGGGTYPNFTLQKRLHIIGEGMGPSVPTPQISYFYIDYVSEAMNPNGSTVEGMQINDYLHFNDSEQHHDITIRRCRIRQPYWSGVYDEKNIRFENCFITERLALYYYNLGDIENLVFENCVFNGGLYIYAPSGNNDADGQVIFRNNLFVNRSGSNNFGGLQEMIFENNIFYGYHPTGTTNSVFNNNMTFYNGSANAMPPAGNQGEGNLVDVDPQFVNYPPAGGNFSWDHNFNLEAGSPAVGAGTLGTDIGLTGGSFPVDGNLKHHPATPEVLSVNLPTTAVQAGGTLQISIEATSRD